MGTEETAAKVEPVATDAPPALAATEPALEPVVDPIPEAAAPPSTAAPIALPELGASATSPAAGRHLGLLLDVGVEVAAVVGTRELKLEQVLGIQPGTIIDLDRHAGEPIELYVNGKPIALAEIVVVDGRLGARIVETLASPGGEAK
jgi:flagellar motor switch protein FliN/FliY